MHAGPVAWNVLHAHRVAVWISFQHAHGILAPERATTSLNDFYTLYPMQSAWGCQLRRRFLLDLWRGSRI